MKKVLLTIVLTMSSIIAAYSQQNVIINGTVTDTVASIYSASTPAQQLATLTVKNGDASINGITIGRGAGQDTSNTAMGIGVLFKNLSSGIDNSAIGYKTLHNNTSGSYNTGLGYMSLRQNTTGYSNTALGRFTLFNNIQGISNTAVGLNSLINNTTGDRNTATGERSLNFNTSGNDNVAIGYKALDTLTTGSNNIAIGTKADVPSPTADNQMSIGNVIYGTGVTGIIGEGNIGIGTNAPQAKLHVDGKVVVEDTLVVNEKIQIVDGTQGEGKVLMSDGNGVARWVTRKNLLIDLHKDLKGGLVRLMNWGIKPTELLQNGIPYDSIIGLNLYSGTTSGIDEIIFFIDTLDMYPWEYLTAGKNGVTYRNWACQTTAVTGADSTAFGYGEQNTLDVVTNCPSPPDPTSIFTQYQNAGPNVHIASVDEALLIYNVLIVPGIWNPENGNGPVYWTSTEAAGANEATHAMMINKTDGSITEQVKTFQTRAFVVERHY